MMNKKENKNKRAMTQLKAYFLIVNVVLAIVAFGWMVGGQLSKDISAAEATDYFPRWTTEEIDIYGSITDKKLQTTYAQSIDQRIAEMAKGSSSNTPVEIRGIMPTDLSKNIITLRNPIDFEIKAGESVTPYKDVIGFDGNTNILKYKNGETITLSSEQGTKVMEYIGKTQPSQGVGWVQGAQDFFTKNIFENLVSAATIGALGALVGTFIGGNGAMTGFLAGFGGTMAYQIAKSAVGTGKVFGLVSPGVFGIGVGVAIFIFMYKKTSTEIVEFNCLPYQPPIGGEDCEKCNDFEQCSEYVCKSLGQACQLLNAGTEQESCDWVNPHDVNSPKIKISDVLKGYKWIPDTAVRPPATGAVISQENGDCVKAFTPLEFTIASDEPSQCKIDYNLTKGFDEMSYYIGGSNLFTYNHTEKMSLPSPSAINAVDPEIKNDGTYTLYVRCKDANGNFNQDAYSVRFCVEKGPDTTPPRIDGLSIPSNSPVSYNTTSLYLEVYVNEPAECKWSREDRDFKQMENNMSCNTNLWEINNNNVYTCRTILTGIKDRQDNEYYFRCKDQPNAPEAERNPNVQSYLYNVIGTQPLNILEIKPNNETIKDSTDTIAINLEVKTDNGYKNGEAFCYYTNTQTTDTKIVNKTCIGKEDAYIQFAETGNSSKHTQRQDLITGDYTYYIKCVDLGGNAAYDCTKFSVEVDRSPPIVVRAYKESEQLKIITDEKADCGYSHKDCNFEIKDGIKMSSLNNEAHTAEWLITKNYYIRCNDKYNNQPDSNKCSAVIRPYKFVDKSNVKIL